MGPLSRAVAEYLGGDFSRFHTPGHKGKDRFAPHFGWGEVWCWDVTECAGLDSLFEASGPIRETEQLYSRLYGTADSLISAGGSTLCIQAMLALALQPGDSLLAVRGVHSSAVHAMALLDLHPQWVLPSIDQATGLAGAVCPEEVERAFTCNPGLRPFTSPVPTILEPSATSPPFLRFVILLASLFWWTTPMVPIWLFCLRVSTPLGWGPTFAVIPSTKPCLC